MQEIGLSIPCVEPGQGGGKGVSPLRHAVIKASYSGFYQEAQRFIVVCEHVIGHMRSPGFIWSLCSVNYVELFYLLGFGVHEDQPDQRRHKNSHGY